MQITVLGFQIKESILIFVSLEFRFYFVEPTQKLCVELPVRFNLIKLNSFNQRPTIWIFDENVIDVSNQCILIALNGVFVEIEAKI